MFKSCESLESFAWKTLSSAAHGEDAGFMTRTARMLTSAAEPPFFAESSSVRALAMPPVSRVVLRIPQPVVPCSDGVGALRARN